MQHCYPKYFLLDPGLPGVRSVGPAILCMRTSSLYLVVYSKVYYHKILKYLKCSSSECAARAGAEGARGAGRQDARQTQGIFILHSDKFLISKTICPGHDGQSQQRLQRVSDIEEADSGDRGPGQVLAIISQSEPGSRIRRQSYTQLRELYSIIGE